MAPQVVERLNRELLRIAALPEIRARLLELGVETVAGPPDGLRSLMEEEISLYGRIVAASGIERL